MNGTKSRGEDGGGDGDVATNANDDHGGGSPGGLKVWVAVPVVYATHKIFLTSSDVSSTAMISSLGVCLT